jgi:hypothetical protein
MRRITVEARAIEFPGAGSDVSFKASFSPLEIKGELRLLSAEGGVHVVHVRANGDQHPDFAIEGDLESMALLSGAIDSALRQARRLERKGIA